MSNQQGQNTDPNTMDTVDPNAGEQAAGAGGQVGDGGGGQILTPNNINAQRPRRFVAAPEGVEQAEVSQWSDDLRRQSHNQAQRNLGPKHERNVLQNPNKWGKTGQCQRCGYETNPPHSMVDDCCRCAFGCGRQHKGQMCRHHPSMRPQNDNRSQARQFNVGSLSRAPPAQAPAADMEPFRRQELTDLAVASFQMYQGAQASEPQQQTHLRPLRSQDPSVQRMSRFVSALYRIWKEQDDEQQRQELQEEQWAQQSLLDQQQHDAARGYSSSNNGQGRGAHSGGGEGSRRSRHGRRGHHAFPPRRHQ